MKLMIVDDNPKIRELVRRAVGSAADNMLECATGEEAVEQYAAFKPDYVLMDVHLGGMNGFTATRRILAADPGARIIIITSTDVEVYREESTRSGAIGFVEKGNLSDVKQLLSIPKTTR